MRETAISRDPIIHETPHRHCTPRHCNSAGNPTMESLGEFCAKLALIGLALWDLGSLLHSWHRSRLVKLSC
jgi:hypothetical protein